MHAQALLAVIMPVLATASAIHSSAVPSPSASASATPSSSSAHVPNTGNSYGTNGISNKGNLACTGKCLQSPMDLDCPALYVCFLSCLPWV